MAIHCGFADAVPLRSLIEPGTLGFSFSKAQRQKTNFSEANVGGKPQGPAGWPIHKQAI
jgi:hypothetical protein